MIWNAILHHGQSNSLRIEDIFNSNSYVREVLQPKIVPFVLGIPGAIFQQDNACPHVAKTVRDFCSAQHMQLLSWPAYSPDMSPIEHVWDLVSRRLACDPRPEASKDELLLRIQAIWNSLLQADF
ncbi:transposable element Tcb2 transposase [Trichonephila clavipes]|nr:transposable element Tcb2 transposase [Trichonephila clavipes]